MVISIKTTSISILLLLFLSATSCNPTCEEVCKKLLDDCKIYFSADMNYDLCVTQCDDLKDLLDEEEDQDREDILIKQMICIEEKSCEEISSGECEDLNFTYE